MINRVILLVIDGFGIGALPDASDYGDAGTSTLVHLADAVGGLSLPNLEALGLGHVAQIKGVRTMGQPDGCFGRLGFASRGKDSLVGYWETCGLVLHESGQRYSSEVPVDVVAGFEQALGRKVIGNRAASLRTMLAECGVEHLSSGAPILWTDGGHTCHVAAHDTVMPMTELASRCRDARKVISGATAPKRIAAHSFSGTVGAFMPGIGRKDIVLEPPGETMLDMLNRSGQIVMGVGKVCDLFSGRGLTKAFPAVSATAAFDETIAIVGKMPRGLLYVSLDLMPDEPSEAAAAVEGFDRRLPDLFEKLRVGDALVVTGDHGRDLSRPAKTPTREYVPLLVTGPRLAQGVSLGTRSTAADLGQTIVDALRAERLTYGDSFFEALRSG